MIFKTINDETDGKIKIKPNSGFADLFKKQQLFSSSDIQAIKAYNAQIDACVTSQTAFRRTMMDASEKDQIGCSLNEFQFNYRGIKHERMYRF